MPQPKDITGQRFGHLLALRRLKPYRTKGRGTLISVWLMRCDCGIETQKTLMSLRRIFSCGRWACPFAQALRKRWYRKGTPAARYAFAMYRRAAIDRKHEFTLDRDFFYDLVSRDCYYCGSKPSNTSQRLQSIQRDGGLKYNGLDRIDSTKGYTPDNVRPCCWVCNRMKHVLSEDEFLDHIRRILWRNHAQVKRVA